MKKGKLRITSAILSAIVAMSVFASCGQNGSNNTGGPSPTSSPTSSGPSDSQGTPAIPADYTIEILTISHEGNIIAENHPNFQTLKEHTGYNVKLQYVLNANYDEQMNTRLASGDLPGLIVITGNTGPIVSAAKAGAFWDITEKYKDYPNLAKANENVMRNISIEGRIYGIYRARTIGRNGISYRSDWLQNLGLEEPKTLEDLYNVLHAFTYDDPDGNNKNDTYGMTWSTYMGPFNNLAVMHGAPNMWGIDENGKLYPWFESDAYIETLDYSKRLYDDGLINRDFAALQSGEWANDFGTGKSGLWIDVADQANRHAIKLKDNGFITQEQVDDGSVVWVMGSVANSKGEIYSLPTPGHAGYVAISRTGAKTEEDLYHHLNFMDKCNDEIGQNILNYGTEGITYDKSPEGFVISLEKEEIVARAGAGMDSSAGWNQFMMNTTDLLYKKEGNPRITRQEEVYQENLPNTVHNPALSLVSDTYTAKGKSLEQIIQDATINYIMGKIDLNGFKVEVQRWYSEGGQDALNEYQSAYDQTK